MVVLMVAVTLVLRATPVALGVGDWAIRVGAALTGAAGAVVKLHVTLAPIGVPAALVTVPATVAVKTVPAANGVVGVRVATVPAALTVTVAGTGAAAPAAVRVKVAVVIVAEFMGLLNVAETVVVGGTSSAACGGAWAVTVGAKQVLKLHVEAGPSGVPATSVTVAATVAV